MGKAKPVAAGMAVGLDAFIGGWIVVWLYNRF
jgi:hypothetical protein